MKAYFHGDRLLTIEGTPQEVALFMDIRAMGPKVPEEKPNIPFKAWGPYTTTGIGGTGIGVTKFPVGDFLPGFTYAEKPE